MGNCVACGQAERLCERCGGVLGCDDTSNNHHSIENCLTQLKERAEKADAAAKYALKEGYGGFFSDFHHVEALNSWALFRDLTVKQYPKRGDLTDRDLALLTLAFRERFGRGYDLLVRSHHSNNDAEKRDLYIVKSVVFAKVSAWDGDKKVAKMDADRMLAFIEGYLSVCRSRPRKR